MYLVASLSGRVPYFVLPDSEPNQAPVRARVSIAWAALALSLLLLWQFLTIRYNREGNWTALFCTGQVKPVPPELAAFTYRFPNSNGYDGQMYRYVAHDPLFRLGFERYVDAPQLRYRRILVSALAFVLAGGRQNLIDFAYIAVIDIFAFLGAYWLSRWASLNGFHAAWGASFLLLPATLISMDRMVVDCALTALSVAFAYYTQTRSMAKLYLVLVLACLTRETGALLVAGCCVFELLERRFTRSLVWATACLPSLGWYLFLHSSLPSFGTGHGVPRWLDGKLGLGMLGRILQPVHYPLPATLELVTRSLDVIALAGMACAVVAALVLLRFRPLSPVRITAFVFAAAAISLTSVRYWGNCYGYSRVFSPLLFLSASQGLAGKQSAGRWWVNLVPIAMVDLRIGLQLGPQALGIVRGLLGI